MSDDGKSFHTTTKVWNKEIEQVIKEIEKSCQAYKWMNLEAVKRTTLIYNILSYSLILLGPFSGVLTSIDYNCTDNTIQVCVIVFSFVSGVLGAVIKFGEYEEKISSYRAYVSKYTSLEGNIRRQLILSPEERVNAGEYLEWVSSSFDELFASSPLLPEGLYGKWEEHCKKREETGIKEVVIPVKPPIKDASFADLNRYDDGKMRYELARLSNIGK